MKKFISFLVSLVFVGSVHGMKETKDNIDSKTSFGELYCKYLEMKPLEIDSPTEFFNADENNQPTFIQDCKNALYMGLVMGGFSFLGQKALQNQDVNVQRGFSLASFFGAYCIEKNRGSTLNTKMENLVQWNPKKKPYKIPVFEAYTCKKKNIKDIELFCHGFMGRVKREVENVYFEPLCPSDLLKDLNLPSIISKDENAQASLEKIKEFMFELRKDRLGCQDNLLSNIRNLLKQCNNCIKQEESEVENIEKGDYLEIVQQFDKRQRKHAQIEFYKKSYLSKIPLMVTMGTQLLTFGLLQYFFGNTKPIYDVSIGEDNEENID